MRKMLKGMLMRVFKMFMPDAKQLSVMAASACQEFINKQPDERSARIARASEIASRLSELQSTVSRALADGKLDDEETAKLAGMLEPVAGKIISTMKENM